MTTSGTLFLDRISAIHPNCQAPGIFICFTQPVAFSFSERQCECIIEKCMMVITLQDFDIGDMWFECVIILKFSEHLIYFIDSSLYQPDRLESFSFCVVRGHFPI